MRAFARVLGVLGAFLLSVAGLWGLGVGSASSPLSERDSVSAFGGTLTLIGTITDLAPLAAPLPPIALDLESRLYTVHVSASTIVLRRELTQTVGVLEPRTYPVQYAVDRQSYRQVDDRLAYAFAPANVVDRSGTFGPFLPPGVGDGPYPIWDDATASPVNLVRTGAPVIESGLSMLPMSIHTDDVPASDHYVRWLRDSLGVADSLPTSATFDRLRRMFAPTGVDPIAVAAVADGWLTDTDRKLVAQILATPLTVNYLLDLDLTQLVEPDTGMPSSLVASQVVTAQPDTTQLGRLRELFAAPRYAGNPAMVLAEGLIDKVVKTPPRTEILKMAYTETPTSDAAAVAEIKLALESADTSDSGHVVPTALASVGASVFLFGLGLGWREHRQGPAPESWRGIRVRTSSGVRRCVRGANPRVGRWRDRRRTSGGDDDRDDHVDRIDRIDHVVTVQPAPELPVAAVRSSFTPRSRAAARSTPGQWSPVDVLASDDRGRDGANHRARVPPPRRPTADRPR